MTDGDLVLELSRRLYRLVRMIVRGKSLPAFDVDDLVQHCFFRWLAEGPLTPSRLRDLLQQERELLAAVRRAVKSAVRKELRRQVKLGDALHHVLARRADGRLPTHDTDALGQLLRSCAITEVELRNVDAFLVHRGVQSAARALGVTKQSVSRSMSRLRRRFRARYLFSDIG